MPIALTMQKYLLLSLAKRKHLTASSEKVSEVSVRLATVGYNIAEIGEVLATVENNQAENRVR